MKCQIHAEHVKRIANMRGLTRAVSVKNIRQFEVC